MTLFRDAGTVLKILAVLVWQSGRFNPLLLAKRGTRRAVQRLRRTAYVTGSLLTGTVTAFSGPISFVGFIVPHAIRPFAGPDYRIPIRASFFIGAAFLVLCDTATRTLFATVEIPVGVITALLSGPFLVNPAKAAERRLVPVITLITSVARSDKTAYALTAPAESEPKIYVAAAEPRDAQMREPIDLHRNKRGSGWETRRAAASDWRFGARRGSDVDRLSDECNQQY